MSTANPVYHEVLLPQSDCLPPIDRLSNYTNEPVIFDEVDENIEGFLLNDDLAGADLEDEFEFCAQ